MLLEPPESWRAPWPSARHAGTREIFRQLAKRPKTERAPASFSFGKAQWVQISARWMPNGGGERWRGADSITAVHRLVNLQSPHDPPHASIKCMNPLRSIMRASCCYYWQRLVRASCRGGSSCTSCFLSIIGLKYFLLLK